MTNSKAAVNAISKTPDYTITDRVKSSAPSYALVQDFLIDEIDLLDSDRLTEWLETLDDNIFYHAPVRTTKLRSKGDQFHKSMNWFHESKSSLSFKIKRFEQSGSAWAGDPAPRVRRFMSNLIVHETSLEKTYCASTNILLSVSRSNEHSVDLVSAKRKDLIEQRGDDFKLMERTIYLDHSILGVPSLSFFI